ncbi:hypothetical protein, partial [Corallococcus sp. 4LFB]|uniref:hypothetical protein n=1 Tax=Corallococcus sp. 4LFB TaxID=3383249 RepID=UPI003974B357
DGEPAAMWAGLGVMGDAALVPVRPAAGMAPHGVGRSVFLGLGVSAGLLALTLFGLWRRRARRQEGAGRR